MRVQLKAYVDKSYEYVRTLAGVRFSGSIDCWLAGLACTVNTPVYANGQLCDAVASCHCFKPALTNRKR